MVILSLPENTAAQSPMLAPETAPGPSMPGAPGPSMDCFSVLLNMSDCLSFVEIGSNLTKPDPPCCPELAGLVESNPVCLCQLLGDPDKSGISVDIPKALKLPSVCGVSTPPVSVCAGTIFFLYLLYICIHIRLFTYTFRNFELLFYLPFSPLDFYYY